MLSLHLDPSLVRPFESEPVRVLKSRAQSSPSLDSSSKIEYESAKKCRVRVESMPSLDSDPSLISIFTDFMLDKFSILHAFGHTMGCDHEIVEYDSTKLPNLARSFIIVGFIESHLLCISITCGCIY